MAELKTKMTDDQLAQELQRGKGGKLGGKILSLLGVLIAVMGIILGGNMVLVIIGGVILGLGQMMQAKSKSRASQQTFNAIVPELVNAVFKDVQMNPIPHLLDAEDTNIPLPKHDNCTGSGYVRGIYRGLTTELCTVRLTDVSESQREETGLWEKNELEVYTGQWLFCQLDREFPTWLTIWPRGKLDNLLNTHTIKTENEAFNKRFNLNCGDEQAALRLFNPSRMERFLTLADGVFTRFSVNLHDDGKLYIAVHSGHGFFDIGKGRERPEILRQRFADELEWFTNMIDVFRPM